MSKAILIVNPFSSGKYYAEQFAVLGFECYSVLSDDKLSEHYLHSYNGKYFTEPHLIGTAQARQRFAVGEVAAVVAGMEAGVETAEYLADYFQTAGNSPHSSRLRRDKFAMQQCLAQQGLNHIRSCVLERGNCRIGGMENVHTYILKPVNAAGSEDVVFCTDLNDLHTKISKINWDKVNITGQTNTQYLVQEFIEGEEYVVDMVVSNGIIRTVSLCRYRKDRHNGSRFVYEHMQMLNPQAAQYRHIIDYAHCCCRALALTFGPVHMEIMLTPDNRPIMIEVGARLHGGLAPLAFQYCYRPHLLEQAVAAYTGQSLQPDAVLVCEARVVFLINCRHGRIADFQTLLDKICLLPSYVAATAVVSDGMLMPLTVDLLTCPFIVCLAHADAAQIEHDEQQIRVWFEA